MVLTVFFLYYICNFPTAGVHFDGTHSNRYSIPFALAFEKNALLLQPNELGKQKKSKRNVMKNVDYVHQE